MEEADEARPGPSAAPPDPNGQPRRKRARSQGDFDQGAGTRQNVNRESAKPPPPTKGQYGSFDPKQDEIPNRIKSPEFYVKMVNTLYDQLLKFCKNAPGAKRYVQKRLVALYKKLNKNYFLLDLSMQQHNISAEHVPGAVTARKRAARSATQIYDILGFDVKRGFTESSYAPKTPKPAPAAPKQANPPPTKPLTPLRGSPARKKVKPTFSQVPKLQDVLKRQAELQMIGPPPSTPKKSPPKLKEGLRTPTKTDLP